MDIWWYLFVWQNNKSLLVVRGTGLQCIDWFCLRALMASMHRRRSSMCQPRYSGRSGLVVCTQFSDCCLKSFLSIRFFSPHAFPGDEMWRVSFSIHLQGFCNAHHRMSKQGEFPWTSKRFHDASHRCPGAGTQRASATAGGSIPSPQAAWPTMSTCTKRSNSFGVATCSSQRSGVELITSWMSSQFLMVDRAVHKRCTQKTWFCWLEVAMKRHISGWFRSLEVAPFRFLSSTFHGSANIGDPFWLKHFQQPSWFVLVDSSFMGTDRKHKIR